MQIKEDLTGRSFGRLTVKSRDLSKIGLERGSFWVCHCFCGKVRSVSRHSLVNHGTQSCGCLQKEKASLSALSDGQAAENAWIKKYKQRARKEQVEFEFTKEEFLQICSLPCHYCDEMPSERFVYTYKRKYHKNAKPLILNGLDRLQPNLGYTKENTVPCCTVCNLMKTDKSKTDFINKAIKIANKWRKQNVIP